MDLKEEGRTIFFSSHELNEVENLCDRIIINHKARIVRTARLIDMQEDSGSASLEDYFIGLVQDTEAA